MVDEKKAVLAKLGISSQNASCLFTENGSMSISAIANWLSANATARVVLLSPSYFTTKYNLNRLGIEVVEEHLSRDGGNYHWPNGTSIKSPDVLWVTNPVYNTGDYSLEKYAERLIKIADSGVRVVLDETLAITPTHFAGNLIGHKNIVGIYTPHKAVCLNALKFSIVALPQDEEDFFDDWGDILFGGLSGSASAAIKHYISPQFDTYRDAFIRHVEAARSWHAALISQHSDKIETDAGVRGHFLSVYFPQLDAHLGASLPFMEDILEATGAIFIPGSRSSFDPSLGLCFRINLSLDSLQFRGSVARLYKRLAA